MVDFILNNWAELLIAVMALIKVVVNLTPTEEDNKIFGWFDSLIDFLISDRRKSK